MIRERQKEGIAIAKREGKYENVGRKPSLSEKQTEEIRFKLEAGAKVAALAREYSVSRQTIYSYRVEVNESQREPISFQSPRRNYHLK